MRDRRKGEGRRRESVSERQPWHVSATKGRMRRCHAEGIDAPLLNSLPSRTSRWPGMAPSEVRLPLTSTFRLVMLGPPKFPFAF